MEWLKAILEKAVITDGKLDVEATMKTTNAEFPKHAVSLPVNVRLSLLVTSWYLVNEALSITENAGRMGAPVPEWLAKYIAVLKNKIDGQVDKKE